MNEVKSATGKEAWVAPEIRTLDVAETQAQQNRGRDGGGAAGQPDTTRS